MSDMMAFFTQKLQEARKMCSLSKRLVSSHTGIITRISKLLIHPDDPPLHLFAAEASQIVRDGRRQDIGAVGGAGYLHDLGLAAAIGEAVERYSWCSFGESMILFGSYRDLSKQGLSAIHPERFYLFSAKQYAAEGFPFQRFTEDAQIRWIEGEDLLQRKKVFVPERLVLGSAMKEKEGEIAIGYATTSGCAAALSFASALLKGILELVERDAFIGMWYHQLKVPQIDLSSHPLLEQVFDFFFDPTGIEYSLFDLTTDLEVPVILCVGIDPAHDLGAIQVGAAASLDPLDAALAALKEAGQSRLYAKYLGPLEESDFWKIHTFEDHVRLWNSTQMIKHLDFLFRGRKRKLMELPSLSTPGETDQDRLRKVLHIFTKNELDLIGVDITPSDLAELGLAVVKVLAPQLLQIDSDHRYRYLGSPRLYALPLRLGYADHCKIEEEINPIPHPFP